MYIYNPGEFKHKIQIQKLHQKTVNYIVQDEWETIHLTKAISISNKSSEVELLGGSTDKLTKKLIIRTPKKFEITNDFRVVFKGRTYKVKACEDIKDLNKYTAIYLELLE